MVKGAFGNQFRLSYICSYALKIEVGALAWLKGARFCQLPSQGSVLQPASSCVDGSTRNIFMPGR